MTLSLPSEDRARGLMAGLLVGDALERESPDGAGLLRGTCLAQLACFTLEGLVRAHVRGVHRGICHPPSVVWHAYRRWAHIQGATPKADSAVDQGPGAWPDGWLHQIAPLAARRGNAPATVQALRNGRMGTPQAPVGESPGHHALNRTLPLALFDHSLGNLRDTARELAALTHGAPAAWAAAEAGTEVLARALHAATPERALPRTTALDAGAAGTAMGAFASGCAAATAHPRPEQFLDALAAARSIPGAAPYAGALLGSIHGFCALPADLVGRLEVGWVADKLARDALMQLAESPSGSECVPATDEAWFGLYPGW